MAGSYRHIVNSDGLLLSNRKFTGTIENLGDAYEMAEEMYGMIWWLADGDPDKVEAARQRWKEGIGRAPGDQRPQF